MHKICLFPGVNFLHSLSHSQFPEPTTNFAYIFQFLNLHRLSVSESCKTVPNNWWKTVCSKYTVSPILYILTYTNENKMLTTNLTFLLHTNKLKLFIINFKIILTSYFTNFHKIVLLAFRSKRLKNNSMLHDATSCASFFADVTSRQEHTANSFCISSSTLV